MWPRGHSSSGRQSNRTAGSSSSPGWYTGHDPSDSGTGICGGRRHSIKSDSGDTGISTYCSEDDISCSSTPLASPSCSPTTGIRTASLSSSTKHWSRSPILLTPANFGAQSCRTSKDHQPMRRCSSLTKLSSFAEKSSAVSPGYHHNPASQGSLDRLLLHGSRKEPLQSRVGLYLPLSSSLPCHSLQQRSPGSGPCHRYSHSTRSLSVLPSPVKHSGLDTSFASLAEAKVGLNGGQASAVSPIQPGLRTQMWLTEQMEYRPTVDGLSGTGAEEQDHQQEPGFTQILTGGGLTENSLLNVKEGLLRQRELEINRQKQQILQLHSRIRENELRAQQILQSQRGWFDDIHNYILNTRTKKSSVVSVTEKLCGDEEFSRKLTLAEREVLHWNDLYKQVTEKYTEDMGKLQEKVKTRDRYISSLKKKCQRESEHGQEKQQRIETLEKYLSELPTLEDLQAQQKQVQQKAKDLERRVCHLRKSVEDGCSRIKEEELKIEQQARREKELIASVHSLQQKVKLCLDDGVRLPMQDMKLIEVENTQLVKQHVHCSRLIEHQKEQIERLTSQLTAASLQLQKKRGLCHNLDESPLPRSGYPQKPWQVENLLLVPPLVHVEIPGEDELLKEMSLCLLDLQALCSILIQRAQGKEPNLSLLLGMKSFNISAEERESGDCVVKGELRFKLLEVGQLRRDIEELRKCISDRYVQCI